MPIGLSAASIVINLIDGIPLPDQHPLHTIIVMLFIRYRCSDIKFLMLPDRMYNIVYSPQLFLLFLQLLIQLLFMCHKQLLQTFFTAAMQQLLNLFQRKPKSTIIADTFDFPVSYPDAGVLFPHTDESLFCLNDSVRTPHESDTYSSPLPLL